MVTQQDLLPDLVNTFTSLDDQCAVVLIGSVANGTHGLESDIDLNVFFPKEGLAYGHPYVGDDNRWQLQVKDQLHGFRIDIAWETYEGLALRLRGDGPSDCWPFSNGRILYDPSGVVQARMNIAQDWFRDHPDVARDFAKARADAKQEQRRRCQQ